MGWRQRQIATALGVSEGAVSQWLAAGHGARIHLEPLPGYAAELEPNEGAGIGSKAESSLTWRGGAWLASATSSIKPCGGRAATRRSSEATSGRPAIFRYFCRHQ